MTTQKIDLIDLSTSTDKEKLAFAKEIENSLLALNLYPKKEKVAQKNKTPPYQLGRKILYYFLLAFGLIKDIVGNFLFGYNLFLLIPLLPNPLLIIISAAFALLNCVLFYAFEGFVLRDALGIENKGNISEAINEQMELINTVKKINKIIAHPRVTAKLAPEVLEEYKQQIINLNKEIESKRDKIGKYQETPFRRTLRLSLVAFGAFTSVVGSYFMATGFLTLFAVSLSATPLAWIFVAAVMVASLCVYFSLKGGPIAALINPQRQHFQALKQELKSFEIKKEQDFENDLNIVAEIRDDSEPKHHDFIFNHRRPSTNPFDDEFDAIPEGQGQVAYP